MSDMQWLDRLDPARVAFGNKARALARLHQRGYPVVPGFAIATSAYDAAIAALRRSDPPLADLICRDRLDPEDRYALQAASQQARAIVRAAPLPDTLSAKLAAAAVRLPARAIVRPSFVLTGEQPAVPGLLGAIACHTSPEAIATAVRALWAELFSARSLLCWHRCGVSLERVGLALLVQPLEPAVAAGTANTSNTPWELCAVPGLGHSLTRGEADPDRYDLHPHDGTLRRQHLGFKPWRYGQGDREPLRAEPTANREAAALNASQLAAVVSLLRQLDADCPEGYELEWTYSAGARIVQFDPAIAPAASPPSVAPTRQPVQLRGIAAAPGRASGTAQVVVDGYAASLPDDAIIVAEAIAPEWLPLLKQARGVVVEQGGLTSHAAILARELGIAAVVGVAGALEQFQDGDRLALDGDRGEVWLGEIEPDAAGVSEDRAIALDLPEASAPEGGRAARGTQLWVSCGQLERVAEVAALPVDGVGLIRGERVLAEWVGSAPVPTWVAARGEELRDRLGEWLLSVALTFAPRPVTYRSTDWLPDGKPFAPLSFRRGTAAVRRDPRLFDLELAALRYARDRGGANLRLLLPFARSVSEVEFCRDRVTAAGLALPLGVMLEVPALLFALPACARAGASWVAIGTSDLAQLVLASDRDDPAALREEDRPALQAALQFAIAQAQAAGLPCTVCGPLAGTSEAIASAVRWGADGILVEPRRARFAHQEIRRAEQQLLSEASRHRAP